MDGEPTLMISRDDPVAVALVLAALADWLRDHGATGT